MSPRRSDSKSGGARGDVLNGSHADVFARLEWCLVKGLLFLLAVIGALKVLRIELPGLC